MALNKISLAMLEKPVIQTIQLVGNVLTATASDGTTKAWALAADGSVDLSSFLTLATGDARYVLKDDIGAGDGTGGDHPGPPPADRGGRGDRGGARGRRPPRPPAARRRGRRLADRRPPGAGRLAAHPLLNATGPRAGARGPEHILVLGAEDRPAGP